MYVACLWRVRKGSWSWCLLKPSICDGLEIWCRLCFCPKPFQNDLNVRLTTFKWTFRLMLMQRFMIQNESKVSLVRVHTHYICILASALAWCWRIAGGNDCLRTQQFCIVAWAFVWCGRIAGGNDYLQHTTSPSGVIDAVGQAVDTLISKGHERYSTQTLPCSLGDLLLCIYWVFICTW